MSTESAKKFERRIRMELKELRRRLGETEDAINRYGRAGLNLSRLRGLRVLGVKLNDHGSAAACSVWMTMSDDEVRSETASSCLFGCFQRWRRTNG